MTEQQPLDLTQIAQSFPQLTEPLISRQNYVDAVTSLFDSGMDLVVLEGEPGAGKTTLAAQFAKVHLNRAVSLFLRPASRWGYDPIYLRHDICCQMQWALNGKDLEPDLPVTDAQMRELLFALQRKAKRSPYYFVVDGLDEVPSQDEHLRQMILSMLPFGLPGFRFLLSANPTSSFQPLANVTSKSFPLAGFTLDESTAYLADLRLSREQVQELHALSRGRPGYLASILRILNSGEDVRGLLAQMPAKLPGLFEFEWRLVRPDNHLQELLIGILAHDRGGTHTAQDLARLTNCSEEGVKVALSNLPFLQALSPSDSVTFVSETFRAFAQTKLSSLGRKVQNILIDDLLSDPSGNAAVTRLPAYYKAAGRLDELISYLSPDLFAAMLDRFQSLSPLRQTAQLGVSAALERRRDEDLMRFAIHKSVLEELDGADVWREEVEARMAVDDYPAALSTAQSAALNEDRLQLLAVIARAKREKGLTPEPELLEQIRKLYDQVDKTGLGERRSTLAEDLIYSLPEIAVELVDAMNAELTEVPADYALARLSLKAHDLERVDQQRGNATIEALRSRIKNPHVRTLSSVASIMLRGYEGKELIAEVDKIAAINVKMFFLRHWALRNRRHADAGDVVEYALRAAISAAEYTPNARDIRQVCAPLPFATASPRIQEIIRTLVPLSEMFAFLAG